MPRYTHLLVFCLLLLLYQRLYEAVRWLTYKRDKAQLSMLSVLHKSFPIIKKNKLLQHKLEESQRININRHRTPLCLLSHLILKHDRHVSVKKTLQRACVLIVISYMELFLETRLSSLLKLKYNLFEDSIVANTFAKLVGCYVTPLEALSPYPHH